MIVNDFGFVNILLVGLVFYLCVVLCCMEGLLIGVYYLYLFVGNIFVGWFVGLLDVFLG